MHTSSDVGAKPEERLGLTVEVRLTELGPRPPAEVQRSTGRRFYRATVIGVLGVLAAVNLAGAPYYILPMAERVRSPLHAWLKPSGYVGQTAGAIAFLGFLFLWLYPIRKRFRALAWSGSLPVWLDVHIVVGFTLPLVATIHASWRFDGLIGLGFWAMMVAWTSGLVGRYLYVRIPRSRSGLELTRDEIAERRRSLVEEIAAAARLEVRDVDAILEPRADPRGGRGLLGSVLRLFSDDIDRHRRVSVLRARCNAVGRARVDRRDLSRLIRLARQEVALSQQMRMLDTTHRLFRYWHVAHKPFAVTALVAVTVHVVVVVALGVTWFW